MRKAFHGKRSIRIHPVVTSGAGLFHGLDQLLRSIELRHHAVYVGTMAFHLLFVLRRFRNEFAHFRNGDRRENAYEQKEHHDKESDSAGEGGPVPESPLIAAPSRRREIAREADHHNNKALEPHANVDDDGHKEQKRDVVAQLVRPERLRQKDVAENQCEIKVRVRAMETLLYEEHVELVAAVKREEKLEEVAVGDNEAGSQHDFGHVVEVAHGDEVFQAVRFAQRNRDAQHHGKAGINSSRNEVRWENRGVPAGNNGDGEVEADYRVDGKNQRRSQSGEEQVGGLIAVPMTNGTAPAQGEHPVNDLLCFGGGMVAQGGQIRDESQKPKHQRN